MKKLQNLTLVFFTGLSILYATTAFVRVYPKADFSQQIFNGKDKISLSDIHTENSTFGTFKSSTKVKLEKSENTGKQFFGYEIAIEGNPLLDFISVGVTSNLISRIEIWNKGKLLETDELGFMNKMTWGKNQTLAINFFDETNKKYKGKSKISMRFYNGTGFFGDIGSISYDLTKYGRLSGNKTIGVFAISEESKKYNEPQFSEFKIWKDYTSID